jgi:hypothetical protein
VKALSIAGLVILGSLASGALGAQTPDVLIPGAGAIGPWKTRVQIFNGSDADVTVRLAREGFEQAETPSCPPAACRGALDLTVPTLGLAYAILDDALAVEDLPELWTYRVILRAGSAIPAVSARMFDTQGAGGSFEIPAIRADSLALRNPSSLSFPDAIASGRGGRSNLVVTCVGGDATVTVDAFTAAGALVQSYTYSVPSDGTLTLYDVFKNYLVSDPIPEIFLPLRVRKISGTGAIWGYLVTVDDQGNVSAERGTND